MQPRAWHRVAVYLGLAEPDAQDRAEAANYRPASLPRIASGALIGGTISGGVWAALSSGGAWQAVGFGAAMTLIYLGVSLLDRRRALQRGARISRRE